MMKNRIVLLLILINSFAIYAMEDISPLISPRVSPVLQPQRAKSPIPEFSLEQAGQQEEISELDQCKIQLSALENQQKIEAGKILLKQFYFEKPLKQAMQKKYGLAIHLKPLTREELENKEKLNRIFNASFNEKAENIIWAIYDIAAKVHHKYFTEGTFVIEDTGLKLLNYLISLEKEPDGTYKRISSHFRGYKNQHYGLDLENLPCNKHTILFGHLNQDDIFIKPENHGTKNIADTIEHGKEFIIAQARKIEVLRNLFKLVSDQDPAFKKERIPDSMIKEFILLIQKLEPDVETQRLHIQLVKTYGIQKVVSLLQEYINTFPKLKPIIREPELNLSESWVAVSKQDVDELRDLLNETVDFLEELAEQDNLYKRTGNEVIITQADIRRALDLTTKPPKEEINYEEID